MDLAALIALAQANPVIVVCILAAVAFAGVKFWPQIAAKLGIKTDGSDPLMNLLTQLQDKLETADNEVKSTVHFAMLRHVSDSLDPYGADVAKAGKDHLTAVIEIISQKPPKSVTSTTT